MGGGNAIRENGGGRSILRKLAGTEKQNDDDDDVDEGSLRLERDEEMEEPFSKWWWSMGWGLGITRKTVWNGGTYKHIKSGPGGCLGWFLCRAKVLR